MSRFVLCACCALVCAPVSAAVVTYDFQTIEALPEGLELVDGRFSPSITPRVGIVNDPFSSPVVGVQFDFGRSVTLLSARYFGDGGDSLFTGFYCDVPPPRHRFHTNGEFWLGDIFVGGDFYADLDYGCFSADGSGYLSLSTDYLSETHDEYGTAALVSLTLDIADGVLGDTNADGSVDITDLNNVRNNFGGEVLGDANGDSLVDIEDLNLVRNNFGNTLASVPEPSSVVLLGILILLTTNHRTSGTTRPR